MEMISLRWITQKQEHFLILSMDLEEEDLLMHSIFYKHQTNMQND